ncbi:hypothetical protein ACIOG7_35875 [Streptomyces sp. NPDC087894]|uniref:hypothetical protein n=1 Tax=Streptomyces sp. NPDC087894 TaxID=3365816 RepID=UPI00380B892E
MSMFVSLSDLQRGEVAPARMFPQSPPVVEGLDEGEDLLALRNVDAAVFWAPDGTEQFPTSV